MEIKECDGKLVCPLEGHFDTVRSQELEALLRAHPASAQAVEFQMQGVTYVCSAFLRVCVFTARSCGPGRFTLQGITPPIKRVFSIAGLSSLLGCD